TGAMQLIQEDVARGRLPSAEDLASMQHARDCLEKHSRSLLRLGRPAQETEPRTADLVAEVQELVNTLRTAGLLRRVRVHLETGPVPVVAAIRKTDLEQVLMNLLKNAVEALAEAHRLEPSVRISVRHEGDQAICVMADNATGIPRDTLPLIFE